MCSARDGPNPFISQALHLSYVCMAMNAKHALL